MKTVRDFIFLVSKITADGGCNHEIKRHLLLGRKAMTNLDSILKSKGIILLTVVHSQSYGFSRSHIWMWELDQKEGRGLKDRCFWTVVLEKTLDNPLDCKEIKPVNSKGNQPWIFIERTDTKLNLQYFGHLMWKADSLEKTLMLEKIESIRRRGWQRTRWLDGITDPMDMNLSKLWEVTKDKKSWCAAIHRVAKGQTRLSDWTTIANISPLS